MCLLRLIHILTLIHRTSIQLYNHCHFCKLLSNMSALETQEEVEQLLFSFLRRFTSNVRIETLYS